MVCISVGHLEMHHCMCNDSKTQGMKKSLSSQYVMYTYMVHYQKLVFFTFLLHHHRKWNETTETILKKLVLKLNNVEKLWFQFDILHSISKYFYIATLQNPHSIKYAFQPSKYRKFLVKRKLFVVLFWNVI